MEGTGVRSNRSLLIEAAILNGADVSGWVHTDCAEERARAITPGPMSFQARIRNGGRREPATFSGAGQMTPR